LTTEDRDRCCCNCRRDIREEVCGNVECHCEIDGHYIGYEECFAGWCRRWARETKWGGEDGDTVRGV